MTSIAIDRRTGLKSSAAVKAPCKVATTTNITLSGEQTVNGVAVVENDRVLVWTKTDARDNGIYDVSTGNWQRSADFRDNRDILTGTQVYVTSGTVNAERWFGVTTADPVVIGTSNMTFALSDNVAAAEAAAAAAEAAQAAAEAAAAGVTLPSAIASTMLIQAADLSGYEAKTATETRAFLEVMRLTSAAQARILRFDKYRSIYSTDEAAFDAIVSDAFSTTAIDAYGAFIDFCGFTITLTPRNIATITGRTTNYKTITFFNGTFVADTSGTAWSHPVVNINCTTTLLSDVMVVPTTANLSVGMCVLDTTENPIALGSGIARETYIIEIIDGTSVRLNTYAYRTRTKFWNFVAFKYFFTFKDFTMCSRIRFQNINFRCESVASCVQMAQEGHDWAFSNIHALFVGERLITDFDESAAGAQFSHITAWSADNSATRTNYGITISSNDTKFSSLRIINFLASQIMHGSGYTIAECHNWQGGATQYKRQAAFIHTVPKPFVEYIGCYIDNGGIEISNENEDNPGLAFNLISIVSCGFTMSSMADTTSRYITLSIVGYDGNTALRGIDGFKVSACTFRKFVNTTGNIPTPTEVNVYGTGGLDPDDINNLVWDASYLNVVAEVQNPVRMAITKTTAADIWDFDFTNKLPFGLKPKSVLATQMGGLLGMKTAGDVLTYAPYTTYISGSDDDVVVFRLSAALKGTVCMTIDASTNV